MRIGFHPYLHSRDQMESIKVPFDTAKNVVRKLQKGNLIFQSILHSFIMLYNIAFLFVVNMLK